MADETNTPTAQEVISIIFEDILPWTSQGGSLIATIELKADMPRTSTELTVPIDNPAQLAGRHAIFFKFTAKQPGDASLCTLEDFVFE